MLTPSADGGRVKLRASPKIAGYEFRTTSVVIGCTTSASTRKVAVSDHVVPETEMMRPSCASPDGSMRVNGHGPEMQEARALRNSFPSPASSEVDPVAAFHLPSGEHCRWAAQGTPPSLTASNARTALPMGTVLAVLIE